MLALFHVDNVPIEIGQSYLIDGDNGHHLSRVLRIEPGQELLLSDGKGSWSRVRVSSLDKKSVSVTVLETGSQRALAITITVIQALTKGDRAKEAIELLTEAGVDVIIPWQSSRSIGRAEAGIEKLQTTARESSKQSRRFWIPEVREVATTASVMGVIAAADLAIVLHESATMKFSDALMGLEGISSVVIVVGPEGGLTDEELADMQGAGGKVVLLGRPILRSAHAGIAAISAVSAALKIW
jgi:16S rRNA (uracil1498-N3)-methyltransferase